MSWSTPPTFVVGQVLTAAQQNILASDLTYLKTSEIVYVEFTSNVTITATTPATAQVVVSTGAVAFDGSSVWVEFFAPRYAKGTSFMDVSLWNDSTQAGEIVQIDAALGQGAAVRRKITPTAASHTLQVRSYVDAGTGTVYAGDGVGDHFVPGYIRVL